MTCGSSLFPFLLMLAVMSADLAPLAAHVGDRLYPITYLSEETLAVLDQDDAVVEDWVETVGEPVLTPLDFDLAPDGSYDRFDPSNLDFRIWLGWSREGRIHVAAQFADDVYFNEYGFGPSDLLTLIVDGDHTGGLYLPFSLSRPPEEAEDPLENNMQAQAYQAVSRAAGDPMVDMVTTTLFVDERWMVEPPFARGGGGVFGENPAYWSVEFYVTCFDRLNHLSPEDSDVSQLAEGKIIGFDIWVFDVDDDSGLGAQYNLGRPDGSEPHDGHDASTLLDGLLLGPDGVSGDAAVESVSWGRIKASLEIDLRRESSHKD